MQNVQVQHPSAIPGLFYQLIRCARMKTHERVIADMRSLAADEGPLRQSSEEKKRLCDLIAAFGDAPDPRDPPNPMDATRVLVARDLVIRIGTQGLRRRDWLEFHAILCPPRASDEASPPRRRGGATSDEEERNVEAFCQKFREMLPAEVASRAITRIDASQRQHSPWCTANVGRIKSIHHQPNLCRVAVEWFCGGAYYVLL